MSLPQYYEEFWNASTYSKHNLAELAKLQEVYSGSQKQTSLLEYPDKPISLPLAKRHPLQKSEVKRASLRIFNSTQLSVADLSDILSSFRATNGLEHRTYPSAGASYSLEIFCVSFNTKGFENKILYYNADQHSVNVIADAPSWEEAEPNINIETTGTPQCLLIFVLFPERLTAKYGERGGRFGLIETGAALQQVAMHIASSKNLTGCPVGGLIDDYWLQTLGLNKNTAQVALGYVCGLY